MKFGIDKIGFYAPQYYIDMRELALARNIEPDKFTIGLGQDAQAVNSISQDTITLGANAAQRILSTSDLETIDLVILATESGTDQSKAGATSIHSLLGINPFARSIEVKQACYGATAAIHLAKAHVATHPGRKALVVASDISRYGLNTGGEPTQGVGSVAILISEDPQIMTLEDDSIYFTDDTWDFWRPNYSDIAFVDGHYSNEQYQRLFEIVRKKYEETFLHTKKDFDAFCFHIPYTKLGLKTLRTFADEYDDSSLFANFKASTTYNRQIGNIYTGSLYLSLIGLLDHAHLPEGSRIGLYSYGSGAVGEFFSGILQPNYQDALLKDNQDFLNKRTKLSIDSYESYFKQRLVTDGTYQSLDEVDDNAVYYLSAIKDHQRIYKKK